MITMAAREIGDVGGWYAISDGIAEELKSSPEHTTALMYRCFHCGFIPASSGAIVHKDTCQIGSDERLNQALYMLNYVYDNAQANYGLGDRVASDVVEYMRRFGDGR